MWNAKFWGINYTLRNICKQCHVVYFKYNCMHKLISIYILELSVNKKITYIKLIKGKQFFHYWDITHLIFYNKATKFFL